MENRFAMQAAKVIVVGQGYVGLPLAMRAVAAGFEVVGIDTDTARIASLAERRSYVDDISNAELSEAMDSGRYLPSRSYSAAASFDFAVITVPTPLRDGMPDLSYVEQSAKSLSRHLSRGATVILESTTYPGTTEELLVPLLEEGSGLTAGSDFFVGYSPERIDPGNPVWGFVNTPKVVSGVNDDSLERVQGFYDCLVTTTIPVSSPKEAELTKLLENTFRHVNIALINEMAVFADDLGVDIWESLEAAATKPFGFMKFTPGPGVGGHCLPIDPSYLSWEVRRKLGRTFRFVELANEINDHMPAHVTKRAAAMLNAQRKSVAGSVILLVGLAYKKNTGDIRESPALKIIDELLEAGAEVRAADNHVEPYRWPANVAKVDLSPASLAGVDLVILLTDHDDFDLSLLETSAVSVFDAKGRLDTRLGHVARL